MSSAAAPKRILAQVEFYLSDRNLAQDDFFREEIGKDDGYAGCASDLWRCWRETCGRSRDEQCSGRVQVDSAVPLAQL